MHIIPPSFSHPADGPQCGSFHMLNYTGRLSSNMSLVDRMSLTFKAGKVPSAATGGHCEQVPAMPCLASDQPLGLTRGYLPPGISGMCIVCDHFCIVLLVIWFLAYSCGFDELTLISYRAWIIEFETSTFVPLSFTVMPPPLWPS